MSRILPDRNFKISVPVVVIGAGACGLIAALAAKDSGAEVLVLEREPLPGGSTALSSGFIPAAGTCWQRNKGIDDPAENFARDVQAKAKGKAPQDLVEMVCATSGPTLEWLAAAHGQKFVLIDGFLYPGHSVLRMHAHPDKTGATLVANLATALGTAGVDIVTSAHVTALFADAGGKVTGVQISRPDSTVDTLGCEALVLACNGYGGNSDMVARHIPDMAKAIYFGHKGNQGDAILWGQALGGVARCMRAYQGHGSVATPHGVLITWALIMEGGIQLNAEGRRFSNEHEGYSEQSVKVLAQTNGVAWNVYDRRLHALGMEFADYRGAEALGAIRRAETVGELAGIIAAPVDVVRATLVRVAAHAAGVEPCPFGRDFSNAPGLATPPWFAVKVTGALFHTQGGVEIDTAARVLRSDGAPFPNLLAGGGAAVGVSGTTVEGYLSGNGLLSAVALGRIAGQEAARLVTN
ncbi:MAG: 3-ketosteroid dehydrogenase [Rhodospirillaceae bacterium]|nr:3-ketosteroid dehydrogenase [Rhodospirillaceae bacterium]